MNDDICAALAERLRGYRKMDPQALRQWLQAGFGTLPASDFFEPQTLLAEASRRGVRVPAMVLPVGIRDGRVLGLDMSYTANERGVFPVVSAAPEGYWRLEARDALAFGEQQPPSAEEEVSYSFHGAAEAALSTDDAQERASRLCLALTKPMYTAASLRQIEEVTLQLIASSQHLGTDPHALRLARAWPQGEALRLVAAERAIAGRVREAVVGFEAALWMGGDPALCFRVLEKMYNRMGWGWNTRWLHLVRQHAGA